MSRLARAWGRGCRRYLGLELAVEYTYPDVPEETSGSYLYLLAMVGGGLLPFVVDAIGANSATVCFAVATAAAAAAAALLPTEYARQKARRVGRTS